jgi:crossover junction endodeoxyribonuclease RusA
MITLPFPPSVNRIWRAVNGRVLLSRDGRAYRDKVALQWALARLQGYGRSPLKVEIDAWLPDSRRRDIDNLQKAALDALQHAGAYADDSQIIDLRIRRAGIDRLQPRLIVRLEAE